MKRNFQALVVLHQFLIFASLVVQAITDSWMPPEMRSFLGIESSVMEDASDVLSSSRMMETIWWAVTLVFIVASVGLILFRQWGRTLFVFLSILNLLLIPFGEIYVDTGWTVFVGSAAGIVEGMIISLMFFSPIRRGFKSGSEI